MNNVEEAKGKKLKKCKASLSPEELHTNRKYSKF